MQKSVYQFILKYNKKQQLFILLVTFISLPFFYMFLDIPKKIINGALEARPGEFPKLFEILGVEIAYLDQLAFLFVLCGMFLGLVVINGSFKYYINVYKGLLGERMLRRLRYQLYSRILRFPLPHFRRVSQGELIPMITAEVEPLGGFIGDAFALPMHQGGLLVTAIVFIFAQDVMLGFAAITFYPIQGFIIPKLQRRVNLLAKERVREVRKLSERIGETVAGVQEIHAHDTSSYELADFAHRLGRIFNIRYQIYRKKFFVKFLNNFMNHLTPFFFYSIGGYFVVEGELSLGALVAVLVAYRDLGPPWRELFTYYQIKEDVRIKYDQVVSQFDLTGLHDAERLATNVEHSEPLSGDLVVSNLTLVEDEVRVIDSVSFGFPVDERVAIVSAGGGGKEELTLLLARLIDPTSGSITLGGEDLQTMPEAITGRRIAFVGANAHLLSASLGDNLLYGLKHRPQGGAEGEDKARKDAGAVAEALAAGNTPDDIAADWLDYTAVGVESRAGLTAAVVRALSCSEMIDDVYRLGLRGTIDPSARPDIAERILRVRAALRDRLAVPDLADLVEPFDKARYNANASLAENLLFGTPVGDAFEMDGLAENEYVVEVLDRCGLTDDLLAMGHEVASTMVELFSDLPPGHEFFEQYSFIRAEDLLDFKKLVGRIDRERIGSLGAKDERRKLLSLPFRLIPARHSLGLVDDAMQTRLLEAREVFARDLPEALRSAVEFLDPERYNASATLQDNILFGKLAYGQAQAATRVGTLVSEVIEHLDLRETVIDVGLDFQVGIGGTRLSAAQRQKVAIARSVLKRPDILIISEAAAGLDAATQCQIVNNLLEEFEGRGLIWSLHRPSLASRFDRVLVMRDGRVIEQGKFDDLDQPDTHFKELIAA